MSPLAAVADLVGGVSPNVLTVGGAGTLIGFVVLSMVKGWLVSKSQVDRMEASYRQQLDDLRTALAASGARADMLLAQQQRLLEIAYLTRDAATRRLEGMADEAV